MTAIKFKTREQWLTALAKRFEVALFKKEGGVENFPSYRITCGFPTVGGLAVKNQTIGECLYPVNSKDKTTEIIINMTQDEPMRVADILAHEMCHAVLGHKAGHGPKFKALATAIGLEDKMTATVAGDKFKAIVGPILEKMGSYEHAAIVASKRKKQGTRMIKASCPECGYTVRTTNKWLDVATPTCPDEACSHHGAEMDVG